jgi:hypothetical protein
MIKLDKISKKIAKKLTGKELEKQIKESKLYLYEK